MPRLRAALERLNPTLPPEAIAGAIDGLKRDRSAMSLAAANREVYALLAALHQASQYNRNDQAAPDAILWTDKDLKAVPT